MAKFTTRVELHQAKEADYETLHKAMEQKGFVRHITSKKGIKYHLPTAEYNYEGRGNRSKVLTLAKEAALSTSKSHSILVTKSRGREWYNLTKV